MAKPRSDFNYDFHEDVLFIEDLNLGRKSVTNDIESVMLHIEQQTGKQLANTPILYRDSDGTIDRVIYAGSDSFCSFAPIRETDLSVAIAKLRLQLSQQP